MKTLPLSITCCILATLVGCQTNGVVFSTGTQMGVEVGSPSPNEQAATIGYKRAEGVTMPTRAPDGSVIPKAFPVVSIIDIKAGAFTLTELGEIKVKQVFATGEAAKQQTAPEAVGDTMRELVNTD